MGTGNFNYKNILAVIEGDDDETYVYNVDDAKENIRNDLDALNNSKIIVYSCDDYINNNSVIAKVIIAYKDYDVEILINLKHGYYSHANIDYDLDCVDDEYLDKPLVQNTIKRIEDVIFRYTQKYSVAYRFSNGETGYQRVD